MTKARLKALLALVVALSLFVCSAVVGFAVPVPSSGYTFTYGYTFPSFYSCVLVAPLNGTWRTVSTLEGPSSDPFTEFTVPGPFTVSYPTVVPYNGFNFWFSFVDYQVNHPVTNRLLSYKFQHFSPVSVPVVLTFSTTAPQSVVFGASAFTSVLPPSGGEIYFDYTSPLTVSASSLGNGFYAFAFSLPYNDTLDIRQIAISIRFPDSLSFDVSNLSLSFPSASSPVLIDSTFNLNKDTSPAENQAIINGFNGLTQDMRQFFGPFLLQSMSSLSSLNAYFLGQDEKQDNTFKQSVPNGLQQQQQQAQNQLTDYENREQAVFDNLNTSLDNINFNQYSQFSPGIVSSMTFINRYVTAGFDGLGDFKIILFLPMVLGIGLSVIGRMGAMLSQSRIDQRKYDAARLSAYKKSLRNLSRNRRR